MTRLKIVGLALACFLAGWLFGSNPASPGASSTGRWIMTGPGNIFLLNTRTGDMWSFSGGSRLNYIPKSPTRPYPTDPDEDD